MYRIYTMYMCVCSWLACGDSTSISLPFQEAQRIAPSIAVTGNGSGKRCNFQHIGQRRHFATDVWPAKMGWIGPFVYAKYVKCLGWWWHFQIPLSIHKLCYLKLSGIWIYVYFFSGNTNNHDQVDPNHKDFSPTINYRCHPKLFQAGYI